MGSCGRSRLRTEGWSCPGKSRGACYIVVRKRLQRYVCMGKCMSDTRLIGTMMSFDYFIYRVQRSHDVNTTASDPSVDIIE